MQCVLSAKNLCKVFSYPSEVKILDNVSLKVCRGESVAIMGASGEGKSTLLHILGTLEDPTSGDLVILGNHVSKKNSSLLRNQHIGFVFQNYNLLDDYTVLQNVLMPALIAGEKVHTNSSAYNRACLLLERVGLSHRLNFATKFLSGGEKQRVAIARALCNSPDIILADEPSGNLDHGTSEQIHDLLIQSVKDFNQTLIVVTHDQNLAKLCDRTLILCEGHLSTEEYGRNLSTTPEARDRPIEDDGPL